MVRRSERLGSTKLWRALKVSSKDVMSPGASGNDKGSCILSQLGFVDVLVR